MRHPKKVCGGSDVEVGLVKIVGWLVKIVGISEKTHHKP